MKLPLALVLLIGVLSSCSQKATWTMLSDFNGGTAYYLLSKTESTNSEPSPIGASIRWIYTQPQQLVTENSPTIAYTSKEASVLLNCQDHSFAIPDYSFHNQSEVVKWFSEEPSKVKWIKINTDDVIRELAKKVGKPCTS